MRPERKARIIAFNKAAAERKEKASDMDILIRAMSKLPPGQLKKVLSEEVIAVLQKYSIEIE